MSGNGVQKNDCRLRGPEFLSLDAVEPWGPWALRFGTPRRFASLACSFHNPGPDPVEVSACEVEPLRSAEDGGSTEAALVVEGPDGEPWLESLEPGRLATLWLVCEGRLASGRYNSRLALVAGGQPAARVPLTVTVRAHWLWAFGVMALGLLLVGGQSRLRWRSRILDGCRSPERMPPTIAHGSLVAYLAGTTM